MAPSLPRCAICKKAVKGEDAVALYAGVMCHGYGSATRWSGVVQSPPEAHYRCQKALYRYHDRANAAAYDRRRSCVIGKM